MFKVRMMVKTLSLSRILASNCLHCKKSRGTVAQGMSMSPTLRLRKPNKKGERLGIIWSGNWLKWDKSSSWHKRSFKDDRLQGGQGTLCNMHPLYEMSKGGLRMGQGWSCIATLSFSFLSHFAVFVYFLYIQTYMAPIIIVSEHLSVFNIFILPIPLVR